MGIELKQAFYSLAVFTSLLEISVQVFFAAIFKCTSSKYTVQGILIGKYFILTACLDTLYGKL